MIRIKQIEKWSDKSLCKGIKTPIFIVSEWSQRNLVTEKNQDVGCYACHHQYKVTLAWYQKYQS